MAFYDYYSKILKIFKQILIILEFQPRIVMYQRAKSISQINLFGFHTVADDERIEIKLVFSTKMYKIYRNVCKNIWE